MIWQAGMDQAVEVAHEFVAKPLQEGPQFDPRQRRYAVLALANHLDSKAARAIVLSVFAT
jgi:hypothetical protein